MIQCLNRNLAKAYIFLAVLFWGASWVSGKVSSHEISAETLAFLRYAVSFFALLPFFLLSNGRKLPPRSSIKPLAIAILSSLLFNYFFFAGLKIGLAGHGGVLVTTMAPLFTSILSLVLFKTLILKRDIIGLFLGVAGGVMMMNGGETGYGFSEFFNAGNIYFLLSALMLALLSVSTEAGLRSVSPLLFTFWTVLFVSVLNLCLFLSVSELTATFSMGSFFWGNMLFLGIFAGSAASLLYALGVKQVGAHRAGGFSFIIPFFALFFAWLFLGEVPDIPTISGATCVLLATLLFTSYHKKEA